LGHCLPVSWWGNMHRVNQAVSVLPGGVPSPTRRQPPILAAYEHFRLDRQGMLVSPRTLDYYDGMVLPFLRWVEADGVQRFEALEVSRLRVYRPAGNEARAARPAPAAKDDPGVAPGDSLLPTLGQARGLPRRRSHPRAHSATGARQGADGLSHRPDPEGARRLQPRGADRGPGGQDPGRFRSAARRDLRAGSPGS